MDILLADLLHLPKRRCVVVPGVGAKGIQMSEPA
jgi:hypothetical protein